MMATIYYGNGECNISGNNIFCVDISYKGAVYITDKTPRNYVLYATAKEITMLPIKKGSTILNRLFNYDGEFKITGALAYDNNFNKISLEILRQMHYSETMNTKSEDMTLKSEELKISHLSSKKITKTELRYKKILDLHTFGGSSLYYKNGDIYNGSYHVHIDTGVIMSGADHSEESVVLYGNNIRRSGHIKTKMRGISPKRLVKKEIR